MVNITLDNLFIKFCAKPVDPFILNFTDFKLKNSHIKFDNRYKKNLVCQINNLQYTITKEGSVLFLLSFWKKDQIIDLLNNEIERMKQILTNIEGFMGKKYTMHIEYVSYKYQLDTSEFSDNRFMDIGDFRCYFYRNYIDMTKYRINEINCIYRYQKESENLFRNYVEICMTVFI